MQRCPTCQKQYPKGVEICPLDRTRTVPVVTTPAAPSKRVRLEVGNYRLIRKLGEGGMGVVFEAEHNTLQKRVALKMLHSDKVANKQFSARFKREAEISSQIRNPHIVDISDFGQTDQGDLYIVMEFLEGKDLGHYLDARSRLPLQEARHILLQTTSALSAAHKVGIVHRDLKPDNVFLINRNGDSRYVKLLDFGIAKVDQGTGTALTKAGMLLGTPEYMSPEQCEGKPVDARSDIYAIGIIAYQLFTGRVPFSDEHFGRVLVMHSSEPPTPPSQWAPSLPPEVEATIMRCLEKRREARYQTMDELHASIASWGATEDSQTGEGEEQHTVIASAAAILTSLPGPAPTPISSPPQPTLNLDLTLPEEDDAPTNAGESVMSLSQSMISDTAGDDDDGMFENTLPEDQSFGNAATIAPNALIRPAPRTAPVAPPRATPIQEEATRMLPQPVAPPAPVVPQNQVPTTAIPKLHANQKQIETTAIPRIKESAPAPRTQEEPAPAGLPVEPAPRSRAPIIVASALAFALLAGLALYFLVIKKTPAPPALPAPAAGAAQP